MRFGKLSGEGGGGGKYPQKNAKPPGENEFPTRNHTQNIVQDYNVFDDNESQLEEIVVMPIDDDWDGTVEIADRMGKK